MVGGVVVGVTHYEDGSTRVICAETCGGKLTREKCSIRIMGGSKVTPGDRLWWQGRHAMWTRYDGDTYVGPEDVKLERVGYSAGVLSL